MADGGGLAGRYTLVVPTYNRPADLARLLSYVENHRLDCPVLVADSSEPAIAQANAEAVARTRADVRLERFDPDTSPWVKFWRAAELVTTPYCSMCADDDLVVPGSLTTLVDHLEAHPDYSAAHGWYFTFYDNGHIGITSSVYRGASIDGEEPLERLYALFRQYEAVTYAVYRTEVAKAVLGGVQPLRSMLGRELLGGALTVAAGKTARLPVFYYGRSLAPSQPYSHWHPLDFLVSSPDGMWRDYAAYRSILLEALVQGGRTRYAREELAILIDLVHLRYLADYVKPPVMDYLVEQKMARREKPQIMQGLWAVLAGTVDTGVARALTGNRWVRRIRDRFFPRIRSHHLKRMMAPSSEGKVQSTTASGKAREYLLYPEFLSSVAGEPVEGDIGAIIAAIDRYEQAAA